MGGKSKAKTATNLGLWSDLASAQMASELYGQTAPARQAYYGAWGDLAGGNMPFSQTAFPAMYRAGKAPIESQYDIARENIMENIPKGGRLDEALTNVEIARSQGLQDLVANYLMDQMNKMYGAAFQAPQVSIAGLGGPAQRGVQTALGASQAASGVAQSALQGVCCFNFLEAEGEIYQTVRRYRDEHYPKDGLVGKGYLLTASWFVPLMKHYPTFKKLIRFFMTKPIKYYTQWYYGENRYGFAFCPIAKGWANLWRLLGLGVN